MGSTEMNRDSSRSHTMFSLSIQYQCNNQTNTFRQGKLNFVDLGILILFSFFSFKNSSRENF